MFSQKQNKKCHAITQLDEYKLNLFMMFCMTSFFSISPLHVRWPLPYIMKNNKSKGLSSSSNNEGLILDQSNGKIKLMLIYAVHLVLITEAAPRGVLWKKVFLEISQNSLENACIRVSFLVNLQASALQKETLVRVFSCEFCKFSKNTFFTEHLWTTASIGSLQASAL